MCNKALALLLLSAGLNNARAADAFKLSSTVFPSPGAVPIVLVVSTTGAKPSASDDLSYRNTDNWRILLQSAATDIPVSLCDDRQPTGVVRKTCIATIDLDSSTQQLSLHLTGPGLPAGDGRDHIWTVLFQPPTGIAALPALASYAPRNSPVSTTKSKAPGFFSPVGGADTPDVSLSGTFLAGGNTKPIYTIVEKASVYGTHPWGILGLPGVTTAAAINQAAVPPNNRTRLDPDSLSGGLSFSRLDPVGGGGLLYGVITQINPLDGEFSRADPSANIIGGFNSTLVLKRASLSPLSYFAIYPVVGLEGGWNVSKPSAITGTAVDLSHYSGIFRGLLGSDAVFAVATPDKKSNAFSITGSWRMRLPAADEPLVKTVHGVAYVDLTTRARNWVEVDITWSPWSFRYLALNAKYQYGTQPPLFSLVDHEVTFGFTLQGKQTSKPAASSLQH